MKKHTMTEFQGGGHPLTALLIVFYASCMLLKMTIKCLIY